MGRIHPLTREQIQGRKDKAVSFTRDVVGDATRADEIEDESLQSYAERRKLTLENPTMPRHYSEGKTKSERMAHLEVDARRILRDPEKHTAAEVQWAGDMLAARNPGKVDTSAQAAGIRHAVEILQSVYRPAATRAEFARAVGEALEVLEGGYAPAA